MAESMDKQELVDLLNKAATWVSGERSLRLKVAAKRLSEGLGEEEARRELLAWWAARES